MEINNTSTANATRKRASQFVPTGARPSQLEESSSLHPSSPQPGQIHPRSSPCISAETRSFQFVPAQESSSRLPEAAGIFDDAAEEEFLSQAAKNEDEVLLEYDDDYENDDDKILDVSDDVDNDNEEWLPPERAGKKTKRRKKKDKEIKSNIVPKQPKGYCSICGRRNFVTSTEAARHEAECHVSSNSNGPWKCRICGKSNFQTSAAIAGHWRCCNKGSTVTQASLSLEPVALEKERVKLSDFNRLIVKSIELFEASTTDVEMQHLGNGYRKIELGNVGIRCRHCAQLGVLTIGSISYTNDLKHLPHNMYTMVVRHLLESCHNVREHLKHQLLQAKTSSTSQSMRKGALGLPAYLRLLIDHYDLTDDGRREGVRRKSVGGDDGKQSVGIRRIDLQSQD
jgi:hypothetical protein